MYIYVYIYIYIYMNRYVYIYINLYQMFLKSVCFCIKRCESVDVHCFAS